MKNASEAVKKALSDAQVALNTAIDATFAARQSTPGAAQAITRYDHAQRAVAKAIAHVDVAIEAVAKKAEKVSTEKQSA